MIISGNIIRDVVRTIAGALPSGWKVELAASGAGRPATGSDGHLCLTAPDGRSGHMDVVVRRRLEPRGVIELAAGLGDAPAGPSRLVAAPYLSPSVRERLREASLSFVDLAGNMRIELRTPGLYVEKNGAEADPDRKARPSRSLRGPKAGRIVRALVDSLRPPGVRELAQRAAVDPGYVSRVLVLLDREALIERRSTGGMHTPGFRRGGETGPRRSRRAGGLSRPRRGPIVRVDWQRLLRRWAGEAPLESRGTLTICLEPRGLEALESRLRKLSVRHAVTGTLAAARLTQVAPPRLAVVYVDDTAGAIAGLELRPAESGANVILIEPADDGVYTGAAAHEGLTFVAASQAAADLLTSPGRGPAEAEQLIGWMSGHEELWRG